MAPSTIPTTTKNFRGPILFIFVSLVCISGFGIRLLGLLNSNVYSVIETPFYDDSFYYFSLGRNLASGNGARIDALHVTNGFQPLWGGLVGLIYALVPDAPILAIQVVGISIAFVCAFVIFHWTRQVTGSIWFSLLITGFWMIEPSSVHQSLSGMETLLALLGSLTVFYSFDQLYKRKDRNHRAYGTILFFAMSSGLAVQIRIDLIVLVATCLLVLIVFPPNTFANWKRRISLIVVTIIVVFICMLPWSLFSISVGKPPFPESGNAVRQLEQLVPVSVPSDYLNTDNFLLDPAQHYRLVFFLSSYDSQISFLHPISNLVFGLPTNLFIVFITFSLLLLRREWKHRALVMLVWVSALTVAYALWIQGSWFFPRYSWQIAQLTSLLLFILVGQSIVKNYKRWKLILGTIYTSIAIFILLQSYSQTWITDPSVVPNDAFYDAIDWVNQNISLDARIGVFQSGLMGYYASLPIINLDGKVNLDAQLAARDSRMWQYICEEEIDFVMDNELMIRTMLVNRSASDIWRPSNLELVRVFEPNAEYLSQIVLMRVNQDNCP